MHMYSNTLIIRKPLLDMSDRMVRNCTFGCVYTEFTFLPIKTRKSKIFKLKQYLFAKSQPAISNFYISTSNKQLL